MISYLKTWIVGDALEDIKASHCSNDRKYTLDFLKMNLQYLLDHNIKETPDFISIFLKNNLKSKDIVDFIMSFVKFYDSQHEYKIIWFHTRSWRQSNYYHKNFVITRLIYDFEYEFFEFIRENQSKSLKKIKDINLFINQLKEKIKEIKDQIKNQNGLFDFAEDDLLYYFFDDQFDYFNNGNDSDIDY